MPVQDLTFISAARPKDWVTKDRAHTFTFRAYDAGTQAVPSSATITIRKPGGAALATPVSGAAVTVAGGGDMTYALIAGNTSELGANYVADVAYVVSGVSYDARVLFDVCRVPLRNVVIQADLAFHHADVADFLAAGESNTQSYIKQAFEDVCTYIESKGNRPYLVLHSEALRRAVEHRALALYFFSKRKNAEDRWGSYAADHLVSYEREIQAVGSRLVYDLDQSGTADGTTVEGATGEEGSRHFGLRYRV